MLLNWVADPLGFRFSKGAVFDFVCSLLAILVRLAA